VFLRLREPRHASDTVIRTVLDDLTEGGGHMHFGTIQRRSLYQTDIDWSYEARTTFESAHPLGQIGTSGALRPPPTPAGVPPFLRPRVSILTTNVQTASRHNPPDQAALTGSAGDGDRSPVLCRH
jgi:hypothetical protein